MLHLHWVRCFPLKLKPFFNTYSPATFTFMTLLYFQSRLHPFLSKVPLYLQLSGHRQLACHPSPSATSYHVISSFGPPALHPDSDRLWDAARMEGHGQGCPCLQEVGWCQELNPQAPGSPSCCLGPGGMNLHYCSQLLRPAGRTSAGVCCWLAVPSELGQQPDLLFSERNTVSFSH